MIYVTLFHFYKHSKGIGISVISLLDKNTILQEIEFLSQGFILVEPEVEFSNYPKASFLNKPVSSQKMGVLGEEWGTYK